MPPRCPSGLRPAGPSALGVGRTWSRGARGTWQESHPECSRQASVNSLKRTNTFWASIRYHGRLSQQSKNPLTIHWMRRKSTEFYRISTSKFGRALGRKTSCYSSRGTMALALRRRPSRRCSARFSLVPDSIPFVKRDVCMPGSLQLWKQEHE